MTERPRSRSKPTAPPITAGPPRTAPRMKFATCGGWSGNGARCEWSLRLRTSDFECRHPDLLDLLVVLQQDKRPCPVHVIELGEVLPGAAGPANAW